MFFLRGASSSPFQRGIAKKYVHVREDILAVQDGADLLQRLGHVEAHVSHLVVGHFQDDGEHVLGGDLLAARLRQSLNKTRVSAYVNLRYVSYPVKGLVTGALGCGNGTNQ